MNIKLILIKYYLLCCVKTKKLIFKLSGSYCLLILNIITINMTHLIPGLESLTDIVPETIEAIRCYRELCTKIENVLIICPENMQPRLTELYKSLNVDNVIEIYNNNINKIAQFVEARDYLAEEISKIPTDSKIIHELYDIRESIDLDNANNICVTTAKQIKKYNKLVTIIKGEIADQILPFSDILILAKYELDISLANSINLSKEIKNFVSEAHKNRNYLILRQSCIDAIECARKDNLLTNSDILNLNRYVDMLEKYKTKAWYDLIFDTIRNIHTEKNMSDKILTEGLFWLLILILTVLPSILMIICTHIPQ